MTSISLCHSLDEPPVSFNINYYCLFDTFLLRENIIYASAIRFARASERKKRQAEKARRRISADDLRSLTEDLSGCRLFVVSTMKRKREREGVNNFP